MAISVEHHLGIKRVDESLKSLMLRWTVDKVDRGKISDTYWLTPGEGARIGQLYTHLRDISLRIGAPAYMRQEQTRVGLTVLGNLPEPISVDNLQWMASPNEMFIGYDLVTGEPIVERIEQLPHMLVAGTTGSGKSMFLRMLVQQHQTNAARGGVVAVIDPKYWDFRDIAPPLYAYQPPQISALLEVIQQTLMLRVQGTKWTRDRQILVFVDEFSLLAQNNQAVDAILNITAVGRAVGVHLVLSTQRPSATVIRGLMKANIPTRVVFKTVSALESRIAIEYNGAETITQPGVGYFRGPKDTMPRLFYAPLLK